MAPNLNGLSDLGLKVNKLSALDLLSSVLENNELWIVFCGSDDDPGIENDPVDKNEPNMGWLVVGGIPNNFVDLVSSVLAESVDKLPKIGLDPKIGTLGVVFSKILEEDLLPNRKDEGLKDCGILFVDVAEESFDFVTIVDDSFSSLTLSISLKKKHIYIIT